MRFKKDKKKDELEEEIDDFEWFDPREEWLEEEGFEEEIEKFDMLALILSGFIVLGPILIILIILAAWLF